MVFLKIKPVGEKNSTVFLFFSTFLLLNLITQLQFLEHEDEF